MIVFGGALVTMAGVGLIGLGHPVGWLIAAAGIAAILGGMYEKIGRGD